MGVGKPGILHVALAAALAGCPLPYDFNGRGAGDSIGRDPSSPSITAAVTVAYSEQGGVSGTVADGAAHYSEHTTVVTLSTATDHAVIYYTDDGSPLTNLGAAKKISASSGQVTVGKSASLEVRDIHAIAIGSGMLPSPAVHATVGVSALPVLTITRSAAAISEDGGTGAFTITASSASSGALTVQLGTSGDYEAGDVAGVPGPGGSFTATIPPLATTVAIPVTGQPDVGEQADDTVTITILAEPAYTVGFPAAASIVIADNNVQPHSVIYHANGATGGSAPVDSSVYMPGQSATVLGNTGNLQRTGYAFAGWNTAAGGTGTTYTPGQGLTMGSADVDLYPLWAQDIYVDGTLGNDGNSGLLGSPVRTITHGLSLVTDPAVTVYVAPGTYDLAHGEVFPLLLPAGVKLIGNEAAKGAGVPPTIILGTSASGTYGTVVAAGTGSVIAGFALLPDLTAGAAFDITLAIANNGVTVRNNTIANGYIGIYTYGGGATGLVISGNVITGNSNLGIGFIGGGAGSRVENNTIRLNSIGVEYDSAGGDMGGGTAGSVGGNVLAGNTRNDLWTISGLTVDAQNNYWDNVPPTSGSDGGGVDVYAPGTTVNVNGAQVAP
jgi:hypothetical protein